MLIIGAVYVDNSFYRVKSKKVIIFKLEKIGGKYD